MCRSIIRRIISAAIWTGIIAIFIVLVIGLPYAFAGYAFYPTQTAISGLLPISDLSNAPTTLTSCIGVTGSLPINVSSPLPSVSSTLCNAAINGSTQSWKVRVSVLVYAMAIVATVGWFLFLLFGSIGLVTFPVDMIVGFINRPKTTITRAQYVERAKDLARRANDIKQVADDLQKQKRIHGRTRKWRRNFAALQFQVTVLEEDQAQLEVVYPQGEDPAYSWTVTIILQWIKLLIGITSLILSILWVLQVILYVVVQPPVTPFLNSVFVSANNVFPLFGTLLFGIFAFYLQAAVIKGNFQFGINFLIFRLYPVRMGATMMSSFLFNVALILVATTACIQFSADAFALYAADTSIMDIYGNILGNLQGLSVLYTKNIFIYVFLGLIGLTCLFVMFRGIRPRKKRSQRQVKYTM